MPDDEVVECPQCTRSDLSRAGSRTILGIRHTEWTCNNCGHTFESRAVLLFKIRGKE